MNKIELPDCCTHWGSLVWVKRLRAPKATTYSDTHRGSPVWVRKLRAPALPHAWYLKHRWRDMHAWVRRAHTGGRDMHAWVGRAHTGGGGVMYRGGLSSISGRMESAAVSWSHSTGLQAAISLPSAQAQHSHSTVTVQSQHRIE